MLIFSKNRNRRTRRRSAAGTSMVELLVVIVVFLIGILAIIQVFPGGFNVLRTTRNNAMATQLSRFMSDQLRGRADQIPEMIVGTSYLYDGGGNLVIVADSQRHPNEMGPMTNRIDINGNLLDDQNRVLGGWAFLSGPNNFRRIVGEGGIVPAPRNVGGIHGGLMVLQFAPIVFNPQQPDLLTVYGNDMVRRFGNPGQWGRIRQWEYFVEDVDQPNAALYLPRGQTDRQYRLAMSAWVQGTGNPFRREIIDATIDVPGDPSGGFFVVALSGYAGLQAGESFVGAEWDSVRVARSFLRVGAFSNDPYEYRLLDDRLGLLLFNPAGYNYFEQRPQNQRMPLVARVNYDVFDWRIIREEFRVPDVFPGEQMLTLQSIKASNRQGVDMRMYQGLEVAVPDEQGGTEQRDLLLLDLETGGIFSKGSIRLDYGLGRIAFVDQDQSLPGIQSNIFLPGQTTPTMINASGRNVRALYRANNEWAVQVLKAPAQYRATLGVPGLAQFYAGGSGQYYNGQPLVGGESPSRIYFPPTDVDKRVTFQEIWYGAAGSEPMLLENQDFIIRPANDIVGLPYIDITEVVGNQPLNYDRYGYAARFASGASLSVRVFWNPAVFYLSDDENENLRAFEAWKRNWRRSATETFIQKGMQ